MDLKDYLGILSRQKVFVLVTTLTVFILWFFIVAFREEPVYSASAKTFQTHLSPQEYMYAKFVGESVAPYITFATRKSFAKDERVTKIAANYLKEGTAFKEYDEKMEIQQHPNITVEDVMDSISVTQPEKDTQIILITATCENQSLAVDMANAVALALKKYLKDYATNKLEETITYADNILRNVETVQKKEEEALGKIRQEIGYNPLDITLEEEVKSLRESLTKRELDKYYKEESIVGIDARIKETEDRIEDIKQGKNITVDLPETKAMKDLMEKIAQEEQRLKELELNYTLDNPIILNTIRKIEYFKLLLEEERENLMAQMPKFLEEKKVLLVLENQKYIAKLKEERVSKSSEIESIKKSIDRIKANLEEKDKDLKRVKDMKDIYLAQQKKVDDAKNEVTRIKRDKEDLERKLSLMPELLMIENPAKYSIYKGKRSINQIPFIILVALIIGIGAGYIKDYLDDRVKTAYDIKRYMNLPVISVVPFIRDERELFIKDVALKSPIFEVYGRIAAVLNSLSKKEILKTFAVVSATEKEGKSTIAANIATALARMGKDVLIIDGDMRRPRLHSIFKVGDSKGLSTLLSSKFTIPTELRKIQEEPIVVTSEDRDELPTLEDAESQPSLEMGDLRALEKETLKKGVEPIPEIDKSLKEVIKSTGVEKLHLIPSGPIPANPSALLESANMKFLLSYLKNRYDVILIDSPPIESTADPLIISSIVDSCIIIVSCWTVRKYQLTWGKRLLSDVGAKITGVVLNKATFQPKGYYYYYYDAKSRVERM